MHKKHTGNTKIERCNINIGNIASSNSGDNSMVIDNNNSKTNYFLAGLQQEADKKQVQKSHNSYIENSKMCSQDLGVLMAHSHHRQSQIAYYTRTPKVYSLHITNTIQGRPRVATSAEHHPTTLCG